MKAETNLQDHWILDIDYSNKIEASKEVQIVFDSIISNVGFSNEEYKIANKASETENKKYKNLDETEFNLITSKDFAEVPNIILKPKPKYKNYISGSQNWVGHVIKLDKHIFTAKLEDKNSPNTYETAQFEIKDVTEDDLDLLKPGAVFYWSIGRAHQNNQVIKQSIIRFKRAIEVTTGEFEDILDSADDLNNHLNWG